MGAQGSVSQGSQPEMLYRVSFLLWLINFNFLESGDWTFDTFCNRGRSLIGHPYSNSKKIYCRIWFQKLKIFSCIQLRPNFWFKLKFKNCFRILEKLKTSTWTMLHLKFKFNLKFANIFLELEALNLNLNFKSCEYISKLFSALKLYLNFLSIIVQVQVPTP